MNWRILILGGSGVAALGAGAFLLNQKLKEATPEPDDGTGDTGDGDSGTSAEQQETDKSAGAAPPLGDPRWGPVPTDFQKLITRTQQAAGIPYLWAFASICAHRESGFVANAHNQDAKEVAGSTNGLEAGLKRGNPKPKFPEEIKAFGSGGLFGALASSFAWIGMDAAFMPFIRRKPSLVFEPEASAVFLAHYFYRITSPGYAKGRTLSMFDVRVGWASPTLLKDDPNGAKAEAVKVRMREDIKALGWDEQWVLSLPVIRSHYAGIKAVAGAFNYKPSQED